MNNTASGSLGEAQASAAIIHPHVVTVHDVKHFAELNKSAIIMQLCFESEDLEAVPDDAALARPLPKRVPQTRPSQRQLATEMRTICDAIAAAHAQDVVHADLKPENVLATRSGELFVTDFGLGRAGSAQTANIGVAGASSITLQSNGGTILGTPSYMSPEQAKGSPATKRSDVYSLGATLYFLLYGRPPYTGDSDIEIIEDVANEEKLPPWPKGPKRGLIRICKLAMSSDPQSRFEDAAAFSIELKHWLRWTAIRQVASVAASVLFVMFLAMICIHTSARHLQFDDASGNSLFVYRGHPWLRDLLPTKALYDTGLTAEDVIPSKRRDLSQSAHWFWHQPESPRVRTIGASLRASVELRWRIYCGDWSAAAELNRRAWADELQDEELLPARATWRQHLAYAPKSALSDVIRLLEDSNELVRENMVGSLAVVGRHDANTTIEKLIEVFERDEPHSIRWSAVLSIGDLGKWAPEPAITFLLPILQNEEHEFQSAAGMAFARIAECNPEAAMPDVEHLLQSESPSVVELTLAAVTNVAKEHHTSAVVANVKRIAASEAEDARVQATDLLGSIAAPEDKDVISALRAALKSSEVEIQQAALRSLEKMGSETVSGCWDVLLHIFENAETEVQLSAVDVIVITEVTWDTRFTEIILSWLQLKAQDRRLTKAAWAAADASEDSIFSFVKPLVGLLAFDEDDDAFRANPMYRITRGELRSTAARSLGRLANRSPEIVIPNVLDALADDSDLKKREGAVIVFEHLNERVAADAVAASRMCEIIENIDEPYFIRQRAIAALAVIGSTDAKQTSDTLLKLMRSEDERYSVEAALSLGTLGTSGFAISYNRLRDLANSAKLDSRRATAIALAKFANQGVVDPRLEMLAQSMLTDNEGILRDAAGEALGEWLWAKAQRHPQIESTISELLHELKTDNSRLSSAYRNGVIHAISNCLNKMRSLKADNCRLFESPESLRVYLYDRSELWVRSAAFKAASKS